MAYERDDRRYGYSGPADRGRYGAEGGRDTGGGFREQGRTQGYGRGAGGGGGRGGYGADPRGYDYQDRGFIDRAGDEVRSWFGDEDAERRRQADDRYGRREEEQGYGRDHERGRDRYADQARSSFDRDRNAGYGANFGSDRGFGADYSQQSRGRHDHDPNYRSWRDRQMESFDRDYDDYRREHQSRFDSEFHSWRQGRQGQRELLASVKEHAEVVGSDGQHVGTVDHVRGDQIELTKNDKDAGGRHHLIPSSWLQSVDGDKVTLSKTADQAKQHWRDEARDADGSDDRSRFGNRSFSRTS